MKRKHFLRLMTSLLVVAMVSQTVAPTKSYADKVAEAAVDANGVLLEDPNPEPLPVPDRSEEEEKRRQEEEEERKRQEELERQRQEEEERKRQEEEERKRQEEEERKHEEEEERKRQEEEERKRQEEEERKRQEEEERKRQEEEERKREEEEEEKRKKEEGIVGEAHWMELSTTAISFGQIAFNQKDVDYKILKVTNKGHETHSFAWNLTDPDNVWVVDAPKNVEIEAGKSVNFAINPKTDKAGSFKGALVITELSVVENTTTSVYLSVTVYKEEKWVSDVKVSPGSMTLTKGGSGTFAAAVTCGGGATGEVKWSVNGHNDKGTHINEKGELYVGVNEGAPSINVVATSVDDPSYSDFATVDIKQNQYTIQASPEPYDGGSVAGGGTYAEGAQIQLVAAPAGGHDFKGWYKDGNQVTTDKHLNVTVKENASYVAKFDVRSVRVNTNINNGKAGSVTQSQTIAYGGSIKLSAKAADGYKFDGWYEGTNKLSSDADFTLSNVTSDRTITAAFYQTKFSITGHITPEKYGVIEGLGSYEKGTNIELEAAPLQGYEFKHWIIDGKIVSKERYYTIKHIDHDMSATAVFCKIGENVKTYDIIATAGPNGVISPSGTIAVREKTNMSYTIVPNKGYVVNDVKVDGKSVGSKTFYTFPKVTGIHTIEATFRPQTVNKKNAKEETKKKQQSLIDSEKEKVVDSDVAEIMDYQTGVLDTAGITEGKAREMIRNNDDRILMELALYERNLRVTVTNAFSENPNETDEHSYYELESIPNMAMVVNSILSEDEKIEIFKGTEAKINVNICPDEDYPDAYKELMTSETEGKAEIKSYFDISLIKTFDHTPELIEELPVGMKIVFKVPQELQSLGEICVVRLHEEADGTKSVAILEDEDTSVDNLVVTTDKLSAYAFAVKTASSEVPEEAPAEETSDGGQTVEEQETKSGIPTVPVVIGIIVVIAALGAGFILGKGKKK